MDVLELGDDHTVADGVHPLRDTGNSSGKEIIRRPEFRGFS
jgi:hypothetical protein